MKTIIIVFGKKSFLTCYHLLMLWVAQCGH